VTAKTTYRWEKLADVLAEPNAADMIRAYVEELSPLRDTVAVNPDWGRLQRLEAEGVYRLWAARVGGTLAGYISFFVAPHHNYKDTLSALDGGHYLAPCYRDTPGRIGLHMWKTAEAALRDLGVQYVAVHDGQRSLLPFLLHLGYHPRATLYWKVL
jgi:hypothetical protein